MKVTAGASLTFEPDSCCGRQDFEYRSGGLQRRDGQTIEAWFTQRCIHCHRGFDVQAFCKQAGDEDATKRQQRHRGYDRKIVRPSTGIVIVAPETASVVSQ